VWRHCAPLRLRPEAAADIGQSKRSSSAIERIDDILSAAERAFLVGTACASPRARVGSLRAGSRSPMDAHVRSLAKDQPEARARMLQLLDLASHSSTRAYSRCSCCSTSKAFRAGDRPSLGHSTGNLASRLRRARAEFRRGGTAARVDLEA